MSADSVPDDLINKTDDSKLLNAKSICCKFCPSLILLAGKGVLIDKPTDLPHVSVKAAASGDAQVQTDSLTKFWLVDGMFTFENVGFSNTVGGIKYLICADCEQGPIGWCLESDKETLYVAHDRVNYK